MITQMEKREFITSEMVTGEVLANLIKKHDLYGWAVDIRADNINPSGLLPTKRYTITFTKWVGQE